VPAATFIVLTLGQLWAMVSASPRVLRAVAQVAPLPLLLMLWSTWRVDGVIVTTADAVLAQPLAPVTVTV
jgi:hypothetical protein